MNQEPVFAPYPLAPAPAYARWLTSGAVLLASVGAAGVFLNPLLEPRLVSIGAVVVLLAWLLALMLRVLCYRFNRHNARCYAAAARQVNDAWWVQHRQRAALLDTVLLGPACSTVQQRERLFSADHQPPAPAKTGEGRTLRLLQVFGEGIAGREQQLAVLLAMQWALQRPVGTPLQPLRCYWQGSAGAWGAFVRQMAASCPLVQLPSSPEPWQGQQTLGAIIDELHGAAPHSRVLCAGCECTPARADGHLPAGEAAVLWLLGPTGGASISRGEWLGAETDDPPAVAARAMSQSRAQGPTPACVAFSAPSCTGLTATGWNARQHLQDANFGELPQLQALVLQTLAAWYAEHHRVPCAWLARDPHYTLSLGIVNPDDSNH